MELAASAKQHLSINRINQQEQMSEIVEGFTHKQRQTVEQSIWVLAQQAWDESSRLCVKRWSAGETEDNHRRERAERLQVP